MTLIIERQRTRSYIYTKRKKLRKVYRYKKSLTLCKKQNNLRYVIFHGIFEVSFYIYTKRMTLCVTWRFLNTKIQTLRKSKTILHYVFLCTKSLTLFVTRFSMDFWNSRRGGAFFQLKNNALCVEFLYAKINSLSVTFLFRKSQTLCVTFLYMQKTPHLALRFYIKN